MSKVLVFIDWYTPAFKAGGPIRSVRNLIEATGSFHKYFIITSNRDFSESKTLQGVQENTWQEVGKAQVIYLSEQDITAKRFKELHDEVQPDYLYLNSLFSAKFTLLPLRTFKGIKEKVVLAPRGMLGEESLKIKPLKKKIFLSVANIIGLYKTVKWHCTNVFEKKQVEEKIGAQANIHVAPNLPFVSSDWNENIAKKKGELEILTVSRIVPIKNIHFLLKSLQLVKNKVLLKIIGPMEDHDYWSQCEQVISVLPKNITVEYLGEMVPNRITDFYKSAHIYCSPTLNENYGHSIVEALGFGCPVVLSQNTPWRDLEKVGIGYDLPFEEELFAEVIDNFAEMDGKVLNLLREKSRRYAEKELLNQDLLNMSKQLFLP